MSLEICMQWLNRPNVEGGKSDNPADHGALTYGGVTQVVYSAWRLKLRVPDQSVTLSTPDEREALYRSEYYNAAKCDQLPWPVELVMFDIAVNSGVSRAAEFLQRAVDVTVDKVVGPATLAAANSYDPMTVALDMITQRRAFYEADVAHDPTQSVFLNGWLARCDNLITFIQGA